MRLYIPKEKIEQMFLYKESDGKCTIRIDENTEKEGYIVGISTNGSYYVELFEDTIDENRKL